MIDKLIAYKSIQRVGILSRDDDSYSFCYDSDWLGRGDSTPLSLSLPLREEPFTAKETKPFFSNLLPEGTLREHIARKHRISPDDDFALLAALAGDCAGAIALYPEGASPPPLGNQVYRLLSDQDLDKLFDDAFIADLSFLDPGTITRLSLAGAQDKLPVMIKNDQIYLPLNGAPSTHIIKPQNANFKSLVENEAFCMALAREIGLNVPDTYIFNKSERAYVINRYDRMIDNQGNVSRIHQEDFCQALGYSYMLKYEEQGGPGHKHCFNLVKKFKNPLSDKINLINLAIFNYLICNYDCHCKNISLIYSDGSAPSLAPFYDLVCINVYDKLEKTLAMSIGGEFKPTDVSLDSWISFSADIESGHKPVLDAIKVMTEKITKSLHKVADEMIHKYGDNEIYPRIIETIEDRAEFTLRQIK